MNIRRLFSHNGPPLRPGQTEKERDEQIAAAKAKKERKAAKRLKLVESGQLKMYGAPQWKPWHEAAKDLGMEGAVMGVDYARESDKQELFEVARLEDKEEK